MKMPTPFRRDTAGAIRQTVHASAEAAAKLTALRDARAKTLLATDDIEVIRKADSDVGVQERVVAVLQDKLTALDQQRQKERREELERQKAVTLAALEKSLRAESDAAVAVVEQLVAVANAYSHYEQVRSRPKPWSSLLHNASGLPVGCTNLIGAIAGSFYWPVIQPHAITEIPKRAPELIERLRRDVDFNINRLRDEPIPKSALREPEPEDEEVA